MANDCLLQVHSVLLYTETVAKRRAGEESKCARANITISAAKSVSMAAFQLETSSPMGTKKTKTKQKAPPKNPTPNQTNHKQTKYHNKTRKNLKPPPLCTTKNPANLPQLSPIFINMELGARLFLFFKSFTISSRDPC